MRVDDNLVGTATEYFKNKGIGEKGIDWDETGNKKKVSMAEFKLVEEIIALQVSFWCLRRVTNNCQSNIDCIGSMLDKKIKLYEETFGKFIDKNLEAKW